MHFCNSVTSQSGAVLVVVGLNVVVVVAVLVISFGVVDVEVVVVEVLVELEEVVGKHIQGIGLHFFFEEQA